jgi:MFS family permease
MSISNPTQPDRRRAVNVLYLVNGLSATVVSTVAPILPELYRAFAEIPGARLQVDIFLSIAALFLAFAGPMMGPLARRWGKVPVLIGSLLLFAAAGGAGAVLSTLPIMIASRALVGIAAAGIMTTSMALLMEHTDPSERNAMIGRQVATMGAASVLGSLLGGWLADLSWRYAFVPFLAGLPGAAACALYVKGRSADAPPSQATNSSAPMAAPARRMYLLIALSISLFSLVLLYTPFRLKEIGVAGSFSKGMAVGVFLLTCSATSLLYHRLKSRMTFTVVYAWVYLLAGLGSLLLYGAGSLTTMLASLVVCALGWGLFLPNSTALVMSSVPPSDRMAAAGGLSMAVYLGQFASPFLGGYFARSVGIAPTFAGAAALLVTASVVALLLRLRRGPSLRPQDAAGPSSTSGS